MKKLGLLLFMLALPNVVFALDITDTSKINLNENVINNKVNDNNENTYLEIKSSDTIKITNDEDIYGIYIIYELKSSEGIIISNNKNTKIGNYLHEYIDVANILGISKSVEIKYNEDVKIAEIYVIGEGSIPSFVEVWNPPCDEADLLLFSTHSDDEQLFFLGLLPTYVAKGANVQVVYFANHNDNPKRLHEQLHGLYTVGIRNYPILGLIPDAWSTSLEGAIQNLNKANLTEEDALKFQVANIRRFKPLVVVGHDEEGEYKHGQHILNTYLLKKTIENAGDETYDIESYNKYGIWDTPKLYLHLYKENPIVMDYDTPLEYFDGKTAYEVSKEGYSKHLSQQWTWFTAWINGKNNEFTKSTDIETYSPNEFGLYRSLVGDDINKNDMFENLTFRKDEVKEEEVENKEEVTETKEEKNYLKLYLKYGIPTLVILVLILIILKKKTKRVLK